MIKPTLPKQYDVAIIGAGPAGLASAIELKKIGVKNVVVLERNTEAGGNPRHCGHSPFGFREFKRLYFGPGYVKKMLDTAAKYDITVLTTTSVIKLAAGPVLTLSTANGLAELHAKKVVISTGIRETPRSARFVSGQRAIGITTTGTLQSMLYLNGEIPFKKPVIVGSELVSFSAIASCWHGQIKPVAMLEENPRITTRAIAKLLPYLLGIPVRISCRITNIYATNRVTGVDIENKKGESEYISCDGVLFTGKFTPEASLIRMSHLNIDPATGGPVVDQLSRCSDPDYFASGNLLRPVETAGWCWKEGIMTARCVFEELSAPLQEKERKVKIEFEGLKYVVPQIISFGNNESTGMKQLQSRMINPAEGRISLLINNEEAWSKRIRSHPEKRILIPISAILQNTICCKQIKVKLLAN